MRKNEPLVILVCSSVSWCTSVCIRLQPDADTCTLTCTVVIYLAELCSPVSESANRGHFCSAVWGDLAVPCSRTVRYGQRCFAVSGPTLWNSVPLSIHDISVTDTESVLCTFENCVILQSIRDTSIAHT